METQATLPWALLLVAMVASTRATAQPAQAPAPPLPDLPPLPPPAPSPSPTPSPPPVSPPVAAPAPSVQPEAPAAQPSATPPPPPASAERVFGDEGEYVISGLFYASLGHLGYSSSDASSTSVSVQPSFDYFVNHNVSMGTSVFLQHSNVVTGIGVETNSTSYGAYLRMGGNAPLGPSVSLRPVASLGVWSQHSTFTASPGRGDGFVTSFAGSAVPVGSAATDVTETVVVLQVFAPILLHPARHFFLGLGPDFYVDLSHSIGNSSNNRTFIGISSTVGGWF